MKFCTCAHNQLPYEKKKKINIREKKESAEKLCEWNFEEKLSKNRRIFLENIREICFRSEKKKRRKFDIGSKNWKDKFKAMLVKIWKIWKINSLKFRILNKFEKIRATSWQGRLRKITEPDRNGELNLRET